MLTQDYPPKTGIVEGEMGPVPSPSHRGGQGGHFSALFLVIANVLAATRSGLARTADSQTRMTLHPSIRNERLTARSLLMFRSIFGTQ